MAPSSLISMLINLTTTIAIFHNAILPAFASSPIQCRSGWTSTLQTISLSQINDGYCDCPLDGIDEPNTGACSGSMDGMWTGLPPKSESSDYDAAKLAGYFQCPEQPSLKLPLSRVADGICDCCDGADEASTETSCGDVCDEVLAEERAARAKAQISYASGSKHRSQSVAEYQKWHDEKTRDLRRLKEVDLVNAGKELGDVERYLMEAKVALAKGWSRVVNEETLGNESLMELVGSDSSMSANDLASFILSLCALSAEISSGNVVNDRCLALDRASLDVGILWNYDDGEDGDALPSFEYLGLGTNGALVDYAEKIMLRLEGRDTTPSSPSRMKKTNNDNHKKSKIPPPPEYDSEDDLYGDDWEDRLDQSEDDEYLIFKEGQDPEEDESPTEGEEDEVKEPQLTPSELLIKSLLDKVPIDRNLFKEQGKLLLNFSLGAPKEEEEAVEGGGDAGESHANADDSNKEEDWAKTENNAAVDPMALQMTKSVISKRLSNISWGETAARFAARYVASIMESGEAPSDLKKLAILTLYHSDVSAGDVAELIYSTSGHFRSTVDVPSESGDEASCSPPWSTMCPSRTVQNGDKTYPPSFIVEAATKRCGQRDSSIGVCAFPREGDGVDFPTMVPDGYYNYYEPRARDDDSEEGSDGLTPYYSSIHGLHEKIPSHLASLKKRKETMDKKKKSLSKRVTDLENEIGDDSDGRSKFGIDGELYLLRDTCHKVESGKYEYELCIFGKATQRDIGQKDGGTNLGSWETEDMNKDGGRTLKWGGGTKCWNGPVRSAEVTVTCGAETMLLTADEPETCRYVFTMESPIGCDERFKLNNSL